MEKDENVVSLAKPKKKGILHLIFSRFFLTVLLLLLQVAIIVATYFWLVDKIPVILHLYWILTFVMVVYLFNISMDASAKLTWMLIITIVPFFGALFLLWSQSNLGYKKTKKLAAKEVDATLHILEQPENVITEIARDGSGTVELSNYLSLTGCFPVYDQTQVTYFPLGEDKFEAMLEEL